MNKNIKIILVGIYLSLFFISLLILRPFVLLFPYFTKKYLIVRVTRYASKSIFSALGLKIKVINPEAKNLINEGTVIVGNHTSYLDMMIFYCVVDGVFITSDDVKKDPVFGAFGKYTGAIFVDRESRHKQDKEKEEVLNHLRNGVNMLLFPEALATDGNLARFRRPFLKPAVELKRDILTVTINFDDINGEKLTLDNKNKVMWFHQNKISDHISALLDLKEVNISCDFEIIKADEYLSSEEDAADLAHHIVERKYKNPFKR